MIVILNTIFIGAIAGVLYAYFGYPVLLLIISVFKKNKVVKLEYQPNISVIITAYNEEIRIREKIENTMHLNYPSEKMQIIVTSDGSTDNTNSIIREYSGERILFLEVTERRGKENAQKEALKFSTGEIIVFSDVATIIDKNGISEIVANFADPSIGCVSGMDRVITETDDQKGGEGAYVKYEMALRVLESDVNTVVGLSGSFFAARKEVCSDFSDRMDSDFRTLLNSRKIGLRGLVDPAAIGYYKALNDPRREYSRKVRTVIRGLTVFFNSIEFCNVFKYGLFSWQYVSHKLFKWLVPFFLVAAFISNAFLAFKNTIFFLTFILQFALYVMAALPFYYKKLDNLVLIKISHFFVSSNLAIMIAWCKFLKGERIVIWQPSKRN
jgi:cellulose synthase/poly-beta-1,6-N-acetylglucosamine synthase-like glycosyltransferase